MCDFYFEKAVKGSGLQPVLLFNGLQFETAGSAVGVQTRPDAPSYPADWPGCYCER